MTIDLTIDQGVLTTAAPRAPMRGTGARGGRKPEPPEACIDDGDPRRFDAPLMPALEPEAARAPSAEPATVVPTPGHGRTRKRGNGKRASSAQAARNVEERVAPARPSPATASNAPMIPPSAAGCRATDDHVEPDGSDGRRSSVGTVGRPAAGGAALVSRASGDRSFAHVEACVEAEGSAVIAAIPLSGVRADAAPAVPLTTTSEATFGIATDPEAAARSPLPAVTVAIGGEAAEPADAPRPPVRTAEDPACDTPTRAGREGLEAIDAETPLCCETLAPTVAVGATDSAGAETEAEAEATGVETVAVGFEPTATVAVTEVWPELGTVTDTDAVGVETVGVVTVGVETLGTERVGVVTVGVETVGVGTETVGVATVGVETVGAGTETGRVGVATVRAGTLGVGVPVVARSEVATLVTGTPSASAAPARPPHANNTSAPTDEALRRSTPLISHSEIPRSPTFKPHGARLNCAVFGRGRRRGRPHPPLRSSEALAPDERTAHRAARLA